MSVPRDGQQAGSMRRAHRSIFCYHRHSGVVEAAQIPATIDNILKCCPWPQLLQLLKILIATVRISVSVSRSVIIGTPNA